MKQLLTIFFLFPLQLLAQDISGIWVGYLENGGNKLPFEIAIDAEGKGNYSGYSHTIFTFNGSDNIGVKTIKLKNIKGNVSMEDGDLIFSNYTTPPRRVKMFGKMFLRTSDSMLVLTGSFSTRTLDFRVNDKTEFSGLIYLRKQKGFPQTQLIAKLEEMGLVQNLSFAPGEYKKKEEPTIAVIAEPKQEAPVEKKEINSSENEKKEVAKKSIKKSLKSPDSTNKAVISTPIIKNAASAIDKRKTEIIRNVYFTSDSLLLSLYDNGTVDGDTVSVVLNGNVIIAKQGLSEKAVRTMIHLSPGLGDSLLLVMYAENLGRIPPNTGVLIIQDGNIRNEIRFAGDLQKSSGVLLKRKIPTHK